MNTSNTFIKNKATAYLILPETSRYLRQKDKVKNNTFSNKLAYYQSDVINYSDYYPFGMLQPNRHGGENYRYGMNGMEQDNEVKGKGNHLDFGARCYDSRLGRWFAIDPLAEKFPDMSPYSGMGNNPIIYIDVDGKFIWLFLNKNQRKKVESEIKVARKDDVFNLVYSKIDETSPLPDVNGKKGFFIVYTRPLSQKDLDDFRRDSPNGVLGGNASLQTRRTSNGQYILDIKDNKNSYVISANVNLNPNRLNYSDIYEEYFHTGQNLYYLNKGIKSNNFKQPNDLTMEVEAKVSKIRSFYLGLDDDVKNNGVKIRSEMAKNGFFDYEMDFILNGNVIDSKVINSITNGYLYNVSMNLDLSGVYNDFIKGVQGQYSHTAGQEFEGFDYLNSLLKELNSQEKQVDKKTE